MPRTGKILGDDRHGDVHRLTTLRPGPIGDTGAGKRAADMYVDPSPYISLDGIKPDRDRPSFGNVMGARDESHVQHRTRGHHGRGFKSK
jgi:hypothetical protein